VKTRKVARRLAVREVAPLLGWVACWLAVAAVIGHADAVRLLAATIFVRSARFFTAPSTGMPLRRRVGAPPGILQGAVRTALKVEALCLAGAAALAGAYALAFDQAQEPKLATLCLLVATGLPAQYLLPLAAGRNSAPVNRSAVSWTGLILVAIAWALGLGLTGVALAMGLRQWTGLAISLAFAGARPVKNTTDLPLGWREIAAYSRLRARRRLTYRIGKGLLSAMLGPVGSLAARTGRGMRVDHRLHRFTPQRPATLLLLFLGCGTAALAIVHWLPEPAMLVLAATISGVAAASANLLIWSQLSGGEPDPDEVDDDDD
jgi:hypothetical protein